MNRIVSCSCGGTILEMPAHLISAQLDGTDGTCPDCDAYGTIQVDADDGGLLLTFVAEERDGSPDCRCEECPRGGPYTCIDASGWD